MDPVAFGIDLHWLPHAHGSIEIAKIVQEATIPTRRSSSAACRPRTSTRSSSSYDCVDYVVRGDSTEEPITPAALYALKGKGRVDDIPNLTWKDARRLRGGQPARLGARPT